MVRMPWGKFKGQLLEDVPTPYLVTVLESEKLDTILARWIGQHVLERIAKLTPGANPDGSYGDPNVFRDIFNRTEGERVTYQVHEPRPTGFVNNPSKSIKPHALNIINTGFKHLAREHHPDKQGGSHDIMAMLTDAVTRLRKFAEGL